jgi:type IV pilus assembly protein PilC
MPLQYRFRAVDREGRREAGVIAASTRKEALAALHNRGLCPVSLKKDRRIIALLLKYTYALFGIFGLREYSCRDQMLFCRQLATLLESGVPVLRALNILSEQLKNANFRRRVAAAAFAIEQGAELAEALKAQRGFFPPLLVNMVQAGEAGGVLDLVIERMADHFEKQNDLEEKIRSATAYPLFIAGVSFAVIAVMVVFVLPQFSSIFGQMGMEMPLFSRVLLKFGDYVSSYWLYLLLSLAGFVALVVLTLRSEKGRFAVDKIRPRLPVYGRVYRNAMTARFARTLSTLLAGGVTLHQALSLADGVVDNRIVSGAIEKIGEAINRGETLSGPLLESSFFPPLLAEMVRIGEETGTLEQTLNKTADYYDKEVSYIVERLSSLLEPALLLFVGLFIGLLVYSILSPMYNVFEMI